MQFNLKLHIISFITISILATTANASLLNFRGGITKNYANKWGNDLFVDSKYISYKTDTTDFTKIEGSFCNKNLALTLGFNINVDNNYIDEIDKIMGYIGYKKTYLRYSQGKMRGEANWTGALATGQTNNVKFDSDFTHIDLLLGKIFYIGLGYTEYAFPVEVSTLKTSGGLANQKYGVSVFDPDFKSSFYSFLFGFDTFSGSLSPKTLDPLTIKYGLGIWMSAEDRIGFGYSVLSDEAIAASKELNPGLEPIGQKFFTAFLENDTAMGIKWNGKILGTVLAIGFGYEISFISATQFGGGTDNPSILGYDIMIDMYRHGPVMRMYLLW